MKARPFSKITSLAHFLHGFLAGLISPCFLWLSVFLYAQFFLYEWVEELKIQDEMYCELMEWSFGFATGLIVSLALMFNGVRIC